MSWNEARTPELFFNFRAWTMICFKSWGFQAPFSDREIRWLSSFGADWIIEFHLDDSWWVNAYFPPCFTHLELVKPFRSSHFFMVKNQRRPKNRAALARAQPLPYICWTKLHGFLPEKRATSTASIIQVARPQLQGPRRADTRQPQAWWRFPSFWVMECHGTFQRQLCTQMRTMLLEYLRTSLGHSSTMVRIWG